MREEDKIANSKLNEILIEFLNSVTTLKSYASEIEIVLMEKAFKAFEGSGDELGTLALFLHYQNPQLYPLPSEKIEDFQKKHGEVPRNLTEFMEKFKDEFIKIFSDNNSVLAFAQLSATGEKLPLLYQSSLISLIVSFELLIARIIDSIISKFPQSIGLHKKQLSLETIRSIGNLNDVERFLVESEVQQLMFGGYKEWLKFFKDIIKIPTKRLDLLEANINEIFSRRNLLVHSGGIVNSVYLSRVDEDLTNDLKVGDKLDVSKEYLNTALELFEKYGVLLVFETWKKLDKSAVDRSFFLDYYCSMLFDAERWEFASEISLFRMEDNQNARERLIGKINYWMCQKWLGNIEKVRKEITTEDFSANTRDFQLCKLALLDQKDEFFKLLEKAYPSEIREHDLLNWPIFKELRNTPEFEEFIKKNFAVDK
ncbi:hypothetical protein [Brevibacillus sp. FIR094]|uniref:hypothetical protein n=1 Tax=Brevibacillus sp. FIR094 TaxID=3134809 RepID=UPI003D1D59AA